jgi:hypothetical protein
VIAFLEQRCKVFELLQTRQQTTTPAATTSKHSTPATTAKHTSSSGNLVSQTARTYVTSKSQCPLCKDSHLLSHCDKFIKYSPKQRMEFVRTSKLCYNCLRQYSKNHACSSQHCKQCNKRHHTLIHEAFKNQATDNNSVASSKLVNNGSASPTEARTYCSFKGKPANQILLATAIVDIQGRSQQYVPSRVLLDSASQLNFITESCVKRQGIVKQQTNKHLHSSH